NNMAGNEIEDNSGYGLTCLTINAGDSNYWMNNSLEGCAIMVTASASGAGGQYFIGGTWEGPTGGSSACLVQLGASVTRYTFEGIEFAFDGGHGAICVTSGATY